MLKAALAALVIQEKPEADRIVDIHFFFRITDEHNCLPLGFAVCTLSHIRFGKQSEAFPQTTQRLVHGCVFSYGFSFTHGLGITPAWHQITHAERTRTSHLIGEIAGSPE
jgi:hypothetical protein